MQFDIITELGIALHDLADDQAVWSQSVFGSDAERGPIGTLKHLEKEAIEAQQAWRSVGRDERDDFTEEMADCLLLVLDANRRGGSSVMSLLQNALAKMKKNKARQWPKPTSDESVEHVRAN